MVQSQARAEHHEPPRTLNHAAAMIVKMGFGVPSKEDLLAIRNTCGADTLINALTSALNEEGNYEESKALLSGVLGACAQSTRQRLEAMGLRSPPTTVLAKIGKDEGTKFTLMVREASAGTPKAEGPRNYVALTLARYQEELGMMSLPSSMEAKPPAPAELKAPAQAEAPVTPTLMRHEPVVPNNTPGAAESMTADEDGFKSAHVYAGSAALCFNATQSRQGRPTISLDAAEAIPGQARKYNWQDKITIQFSTQETPLVYAVLMGYMDKFKGAGHGSANEKWFTIDKQQGKLFVSVNRKGASPRGVPVTAGDLYPVTCLLMRQLQADAPHLTSALINAIAQRAASLFNETSNGGNKD